MKKSAIINNKKLKGEVPSEIEIISSLDHICIMLLDAEQIKQLIPEQIKHLDFEQIKYLDLDPSLHEQLINLDHNKLFRILKLINESEKEKLIDKILKMK